MNQGISVILANSLKGQQIINDIQDSMKLFEIPENTFSNMKARYSECHSRSIMSEQFVKDTEKNGFSREMLFGKFGCERILFYTD